MNVKRPGKKPQGQTIVFRADADAATGTGHVMRCLALAQALRDMDVSVFFIVAKKIPSLEPRLRRDLPIHFVTCGRPGTKQPR